MQKSCSLLFSPCQTEFNQNQLVQLPVMFHVEFSGVKNPFWIESRHQESESILEIPEDFHLLKSVSTFRLFVPGGRSCDWTEIDFSPHEECFHHRQCLLLSYRWTLRFYHCGCSVKTSALSWEDVMVSHSQSGALCLSLYNFNSLHSVSTSDQEEEEGAGGEGGQSESFERKKRSWIRGCVLLIMFPQCAVYSWPPVWHNQPLASDLHPQDQVKLLATQTITSI